MRGGRLMTISEHIACGCRVALASTLLFGCTLETGAPEQTEEETGLPQRAIRAVNVSTVDHFKALIEINYYYDRIGIAGLTAAAPAICARRGMVVDKAVPPPATVNYALLPSRSQIFKIRCR